MASGQKILVIDDEAVVTKSCSRILKSEGFEVRVTSSGSEGLSLARSRDFDVVMTDLKMPDLDGMRIVETLRREKAGIPVVVITGYGTPETEAQAEELGVADYIEKPFTPEQIAEAVSRAIAEVSEEEDEIGLLVERYGSDAGSLIQMLLDVQRIHGYLPMEWLVGLSERLDVPLPRIYQAATFYKAFSLEPKGKHSIQVCTGTACHVRGAPVLVSRISGILGVGPGETTDDGLFSFETVNCLGCCALGPVLAVDKKYYSDPPAVQIRDIVDAVRKEG
jgi:NADH:ubiquinone oxidoreductase subunit E